jgi:hypothetical protein
LSADKFLIGLFPRRNILPRRIILAHPLAWKDHPRMILLEETKGKDDPSRLNILKYHKKCPRISTFQRCSKMFKAV